MSLSTESRGLSMSTEDSSNKVNGVYSQFREIKNASCIDQETTTAPGPFSRWSQSYPWVTRQGMLMSWWQGRNSHWSHLSNGAWVSMILWESKQLLLPSLLPSAYFYLLFHQPALPFGRLDFLPLYIFSACNSEIKQNSYESLASQWHQRRPSLSLLTVFTWLSK